MLRFHPAHGLRPRPPAKPPSSYLKLRPPPQTPPTRAGTLCSDPAHHSSWPRPCPPPALKASCCRGVCSEPSGLPSALAATPVVRVRGVSDRVSPAARTWYSRAVGAIGSCSPGRAFQIVPRLTCTDMEGRLLRGLPAQQVSEAGDWRAGAWREIGSRACSVALHAPRLHPRRRLRPGLEKDTGALLTCRSSSGLQSRGGSWGAGAGVAPSASSSCPAVHLINSVGVHQAGGGRAAGWTLKRHVLSFTGR